MNMCMWRTRMGGREGIVIFTNLCIIFIQQFIIILFAPLTLLLAVDTITINTNVIPYLNIVTLGYLNVPIGSFEEGEWPNINGPAFPKSRKHSWQGISLSIIFAIFMYI